MKPAYRHNELIHNLKAPKEVVPIILDLVKPTSVLDVGCGTGTWLKVFEEAGVNDYVGIDADYLNKKLLKIPETKFRALDLRKTWSLERKFDLVVSLEVAEHLPEESAELFVASLANHADTIVFSAAVPGQGGQNHLNEQWPDYWQKKFLRHGFHFHDAIRPLIWGASNVDWWYRQNIFLLNKFHPAQEINVWVLPENLSIQTKLKNEILQGELGVRASFKILLRSIRTRLLGSIK